MKMGDGGYAKHADIEKVSPPEGETIVYAPVMQRKNATHDPHTPRPGESETIAEWRNTPEAKEIYKERASTAECVNAIARNRGLWQFAGRALLIGLKWAQYYDRDSDR